MLFLRRLLLTINVFTIRPLNKNKNVYYYLILNTLSRHKINRQRDKNKNKSKQRISKLYDFEKIMQV